MEKADIFLFTSDRREGWGAVANEAMNSACALVVSGKYPQQYIFPGYALTM